MSLTESANDLPGIPSLFIAESMAHVTFKSSMCSFNYSTTCVPKCIMFFFLQIANTGIKRKRGEKKKRERYIIQLKLNFLEDWHAFYSRSWHFPTSLRDSWLSCSVLCFDTWPILRCFENVPWSLISLKHQTLWKGWSKRWDIRRSMFSCFTYLGTRTLFSFPHLILMKRSPWWAINSLMTRMNTVRTMYEWRLINKSRYCYRILTSDWLEKLFEVQMPTGTKAVKVQAKAGFSN